MSTGFDTFVDKGEPVTVKPKTWTTVERLETNDLTVATIFHAQLYAEMHPTRPKNIRTRLLRVGPNPDDATAYQNHYPGTITVSGVPTWEGIVTIVEGIDGTEWPIDLQIWQDGGGDMTVSTDIEKVLVPAVYAAHHLKSYLP